ncbi:putative inactive receptor kinase [Platanthera guangdongensis]|uniref:Inactive receptor kinase n=1 Tax=Platanthera guangdongensis TaxID=2320717 RepID=A0ABR2LVF9_9ASPA
MLQNLSFANNQLTGILPPSLGSISLLEHLDLSSNLFVGHLPPELMELGNLIYMNLSWNRFDDSLPSGFGKLQKLKYLDLSSNRLKGTLMNETSQFLRLKSLRLSNNLLEGEVPVVLGTYPDITAVDLSVNHLSGQLPPSLFTSGRLTNLNLSFNKLTGTIVLDKLTAKSGLVSVDLSNNFLSGSLPREMITLWQLQLLNVSWNNISGQIPKDMIGNTSTSMSQFLSSPPSIRLSSTQRPSILGVYSPDRLAGDLHLFDNSAVFTVEELSRAPAEIIGRSCHGTSYKANLDKGHVLAVKWLKEGIAKSKKEFSREARKLGTFRHPNLVSLKGYYWGPKEHEKLLISDCVDGLSLTIHLCEFKDRMLRPLSLAQRLTIAADVACCLNHLHNEKSIPHGNLKPTNIIIQSPNMNALVTDYSLHRIMTPSGMAEQVLNAGALGYRPPEFANTSKPCPSLKSDVYAFGVILIELLTGRSAGEIVFENPGVVDLTDWVRSLAGNNRSYECFDKNMPLEEEDDKGRTLKLMEELLGVALRCIRSADERPEIKTVFNDVSSLLL